MKEDDFARFVNLLQTLGWSGVAAKGEDSRQRALALLSEHLPELTDNQVTALLELEKEYVRRFEEESQTSLNPPAKTMSPLL
jgi:hypothetical protein